MIQWAYVKSETGIEVITMSQENNIRTKTGGNVITMFQGTFATNETQVKATVMIH